MQTVILLVCLFSLFLMVYVVARMTANGVNERLQLYRNQFTETAEVALSDLFIFANPQLLFLCNLVALVVVPLVLHLVFKVTILTVASFGVLLITPRLIYGNLRIKRLLTLEEQLPDAFMMLSSSLQAGASLNVALESVVRQSPAPLNQEFGILVARMRLGTTLEDALIELERRIPIPSFIMASSAMRISREVGGNLMETIDGMAETLRRKKMMEGKIKSLTAQGRAQGLFMSGLPIFLAIALSFLEPDAMKQLVTTPMGLAILAVMVVMQVVGFMFIRKVTRIEV